MKLTETWTETFNDHLNRHFFYHLLDAYTMKLEKGITWSDGVAAEAFRNPMTNFPSGSKRLNVTEEKK